MDNSQLLGAVLLDLIAAFDVIDHSILIARKLTKGEKCYSFSPLVFAQDLPYCSYAC